VDAADWGSMKAVTDISGERFGRLTVLNGVSGSGGKNKHVRWHCRCDCGIEKEVRGDRLRAGKTRSCGCLMLDVAREMKTTHGMSNRPEYCAYMTAYHRCTNPNNKRWDSYGGRGIEFRFT
jgi:hypothetical protein